MSNITDSKESFLSGLSDLWLRFFKDKNQLAAMYRGTEILIGQAYLNMMSDVLNTSVRKTPLFNKEYFKLLTIREDELEYSVSLDRYVIELSDNIKDFQHLYNKIFGPTVLFEKGIVGTNGFEIDLTGTRDELRFRSNLFDWDNDGTNKTVPGVAVRTLEVEDASGVISEQRQLSFWIPDAQVDKFNLYLNYGYLLNRFEPSSESYRALLQGIMRYFVLGPTLGHVVSTLNIITGLPTVQNDGEILQSVDTSDSEANVVKTDQTNYSFAKEIPLRADITNEDNWETLELNAFDVLTTVFTVKDAIKNPTWWHDTTIPQQMLPDEPRARRIISPKLVENVIGNPAGQVRIGDPGFIIGCDDDGFCPGDYGLTRPAYRHLFSYLIFEQYMKHHIFGIVYDVELMSSGTSIPFPQVSADIQEVVVAGKPAYVFLQMEPSIVWEDVFHISEELAIKVESSMEERIDVIDNILCIGTRSWSTGDYFLLKYRVLSFQSGGYTPAIDSDVGEEILGAITGDQGILASFDNTTREWVVVSNDSGDTFDTAEGVSIPLGTGGGTTDGASIAGTEPFIGNADDHGGGIHPIMAIGENAYIIGGTDPKKISQREYVRYNLTRFVLSRYCKGPPGTFYVSEDVGRWLEFDDGAGNIYWAEVLEVISDTEVYLNKDIGLGTFTIKLWAYENQAIQLSMGEALQVRTIV